MAPLAAIETFSLDLRLFGPFSACVRGEPLRRLYSRKGHCLLALLALRQGREVQRDWLAGTLWPESTQSQALYNLRRCLTDLRQALGPQAGCLCSPTSHSLQLIRDGVSVDALEFDAEVARGDPDSLARAVALYKGQLLEGWTEEWALEQRIPREQEYLSSLQTLAEDATARKEPAQAVRSLRQALAAVPLREDCQRALMQALADCGDYAAVTQVYRDLRLLLRRELASDPAPETAALYKQLRQQALQPVRLAPGPAHDFPLRRLPVPLTELIGREQELGAVAGFLGPGRLVTLTGSGGVGKTRLAIAVGETLAATFADGVWFVELAARSDPALVADAVAQTLGIREATGRPLMETIVCGLSNRSLLLILDNCEHLLDSCASLVDTILSACPGVRVLATSRQPLGLNGERIYRVPSLALPPPERVEDHDTASLLEFAAVRLFVERAAFAHTAFRLERQNAGAVASICRGLDGIPLAIELAAARTKALSVEEISGHLDARFRLLTSGSRAALPRHRTLAGLIDWSYDLLSPQEKALLPRLSVFAGGWTLGAAEEVCGCVDVWVYGCHSDTPTHPHTDTSTQIDVLDALAGLVEKSLVMKEQGAGGQSRYHLLETVREYARNLLRESGGSGVLRAQHQGYFLNLAEEARGKLYGPEQGLWLLWLEIEHDNLRQALAFCLEHADRGEIGLRLGAALCPFWRMQSHLIEGRERLATLLARPEAREHTQARADALNGAGSLSWVQGDYASARSVYGESLAISRELGDRQSIAYALLGLGQVAYRQSDYATARSLNEECLEILRLLGDRRGIGISLNNLGNVARNHGDYASARALYGESLAILRELDHKFGLAHPLMNLGNVARNLGDYASARGLYGEGLALFQEGGFRQGIAYALLGLGQVAYRQCDYASARSLIEESLEIFRLLGDRRGIAMSLNNLGNVARDRGDLASARSAHQESLEIYSEVGNRRGIAESLESFASLSAAQDKREQAGRLWGAAERLRAEIGSPLALNEREAYDCDVATAQQALGEAAFAEAWAEGRAMTMEQAIAYALQPNEQEQPCLVISK